MSQVQTYLDPELGHSLLALCIAAAISWCATPFAARVAWALGCVDRPGPRRVHQYPTPRLGGLAVWLGLSGACLLAGLPLDWWPLLGVASAVFLLGARDDQCPLRPLTKICGLSLATLGLHGMGLGIAHLSIPGLGSVALGSMTLPVTLFWVLACSNAVNLIDGADGLGAGISLIVAGGLMLVCLALGCPELALLCGATAGAAGGFLFHNHEPAKIFLGDSGSLLLGFLLAAVGSAGCSQEGSAVLLPVTVLALGVPFTDTAQSFLRRFNRALRNYGPRRLLRALAATAIADQRHIHHRLLLRGYSHRQVAGLLCLITTLCSLSSMTLLPRGELHISAALGTILLGALVLLRLASIGRQSLAMARALRRLRSPATDSCSSDPSPAEDRAPQGLGPVLDRTSSPRQHEVSRG